MRRIQVVWVALWFVCLLAPALPVYSAERGALALIGGGFSSFAPGLWSEPIFRWIIGKAGSGHIAILSCTDQVDSWPNYFVQLGAASAEVVSLPHRFLADRPETYRTLEKADGIFIVDSQLWQQIDLWKGTRTESAIRDHFAAGKIVAGLGEGAQILGGILLDRVSASGTPKDFIRHPVPATATFITDFCAFQTGVFIVPDFTWKGALPGLLNTMARYHEQSPGSWPVGLGIDQHTALLIDETGQATVTGAGSVWIVRPTASTTTRLDSRLPPAITHITCDVMTEGYVYDLNTLEIVAVPPTSEAGLIPPTDVPLIPQTLDGSSVSARESGEAVLTNVDLDAATFRVGAISERPGSATIPGTIIMTKAFSHRDFYENRLGGLLWGLARHPGLIGVLLDETGKMEIRDTGDFVPLPVTDQPAAMIFDTTTLEWHGFSTWRNYPDSVKTRCSVALIGLRVHLLPSRFRFSLGDGSVVQDP